MLCLESRSTESTAAKSAGEARDAGWRTPPRLRHRGELERARLPAGVSGFAGRAVLSGARDRLVGKRVHRRLRGLLRNQRPGRLPPRGKPEQPRLRRGQQSGHSRGQGRLRGLLNNDAAADPRWVDALVAAAEADPAVACATRIYVAAAAEPSRRRWSPRLRRRHRSRAGAPRVGCGSATARKRMCSCRARCAALYRRSMLDEIGLFDEDFFAYCEDTDLGLRARIAGWRCRHAPTAIAKHHYWDRRGLDSPFKAFHVERNRIWVVVTCFSAHGRGQPRFTLMATLRAPALRDAHRPRRGRQAGREAVAMGARGDHRAGVDVGARSLARDVAAAVGAIHPRPRIGRRELGEAVARPPGQVERARPSRTDGLSLLRLRGARASYEGIRDHYGIDQETRRLHPLLPRLRLGHPRPLALARRSWPSCTRATTRSSPRREARPSAASSRRSSGAASYEPGYRRRVALIQAS